MKTLSGVPGANFDLSVEWEDTHKVLMTTAAIEGIEFKDFDGLDDFLVLLNSEICPYIDCIKGGKLGSTPIRDKPDLLAPSFQFYLSGCEKESHEIVQEGFSRLLFDKAAPALWITRTVFAYVSATGHEPNAPERMRLLQLEHGKFQLALREHEGGMLPRGFYTSLYGENTATRH